MVTFAVGLTAAGGFMAWLEAGRAMTAELDRRARWVARAGADIGLIASSFSGLLPGNAVRCLEGNPRHAANAVRCLKVTPRDARSGLLLGNAVGHLARCLEPRFP